MIDNQRRGVAGLFSPQTVNDVLTGATKRRVVESTQQKVERVSRELQQALIAVRRNEIEITARMSQPGLIEYFTSTVDRCLISPREPGL
jgi:hypothetical protein